MKKFLFSLICLTSVISTSLFANITTDLVAHYEFENNTEDSSGNSYDLAISATQSYETGKIGSSYNFNGSDNYLELGSTTIPTSTAGTISFWMNTTDTTAHDLISSDSPSAFSDTQNTLIQSGDTSNGGKISAYGSNGTRKNIDSTPTIHDGNWHHIVLTFNGVNTGTFYIDKVLMTLDHSGEDDYYSLGSLLKIGQTDGSSENYVGLMDDVRIYSRALTSTEVTELYNYIPTTTDCYDINNVGTTGVNAECIDQLIVDRESLDIMIADGVDVTNVFTGQITDMSDMFIENDSFNQDISSWDTSNVTNMSNMFSGATIFNQDISDWNTSSVTDMSGMFSYNSIFDQDISDWNTSSVIYMPGMFSENNHFNQNINSWDTSSVIDMTEIFSHNEAFNQDISSWDTSNVINMTGMFSSNKAFNQDISSWDTSSVTNMSDMFYGNEAFDQNLSSWCVSNITSKPSDFDTDSLLLNSPSFLPIWGTCPITNSIPTITMGDTSASEDVAQIIAKATDSDGTLISSALSASHGSVTINLSSGDITYTPNADFSGTDTVVMSVTDNKNGISETITASITVAKTIIVPVNHAPTFDNSTTSITTIEGTSNVATWSASDTDGDTVSYSLSGDDAQFFEIDSMGVLNFKTIPYYTNPLDADKNNIYTLTIKASDGAASTQKTVTITVEVTTVSILNDSIWKQNIGDENYRNSSVVDNGIYATLSATKIVNSSSSIELYQDDLVSMKEAIADVKVTNIDENSYIKLIVSDDSTQASISINSQEAIATVTQNDEVVFTQNIYDIDTSDSFVNTRLHLNIWIEDDKVNFNVTDTNNNQIGRVVKSTDNFLIEGFTKRTLQGTIQSDANIDMMSFDVYDITTQDTLSYSYLKRLSHLESDLDASTYTNASALDMNNTQFFEMRTKLDENQYITLELNQINPYTDEILQSKVIINHKNIITSEEKSKDSINETENIKYQGVVSTSEMNTILANNSVPYTLSEGAGYKVYSQQLDTNTTTLTYFFDAIAIKELATNYGVTKTPLQERTLTDTYNYVSLPSSITLCTNNYQTSLTTLCNQDYDIETLFADVDAVFKYTDSWNYWTPDTSVSDNNYNLDILGTLNNKEGFIVKLSGSVQTLDLPYNLYSKIQTNVISLYQEGWTLTSAPDGYSVSEIEEMVQSQGKTLKYILRLNDNVWNVYAPLTDVDVDQSLIRMTSVEKGESFWIYVE